MYFSTISGALICGLMLILSTLQSANGTNVIEFLRSKMISYTNDSRSVCQVLADRTMEERDEISTEYQVHYGEDLVESLRSVTSGLLQDLLVTMMTSTSLYYANRLHDAIYNFRRWDIDAGAIVEIMFLASNDEIREINNYFLFNFNESLKEVLEKRTFGHFRNLTIALSQANRDENKHVDMDLAWEEAYQLSAHGKERNETDGTFFISTFVEKNVAQLNHIFSVYNYVTNSSISQSIEHAFYGKFEASLLAIVEYVTRGAEIYAEKIFKAINGSAGNYHEFINLIVSLPKENMTEIKSAFEKLYNQRLDHFIFGHFEGDFGFCLERLIAQLDSGNLPLSKPEDLVDE